MPDSTIGFEPFIQTFRTLMDMQRDGAKLDTYIKPLADTLDGLRAERELIGSAKEIEKQVARADERERKSKATLEAAQVKADGIVAKAQADATSILDKANEQMAGVVAKMEDKRAQIAAAGDAVRVTKEERAAFEGEKRQTAVEARNLAAAQEAVTKLKAEYESKMAAFNKLAGAA